jgi:hypothetical protein
VASLWRRIDQTSLVVVDIDVAIGCRLWKEQLVDKEDRNCNAGQIVEKRAIAQIKVLDRQVIDRAIIVARRRRHDVDVGN